MNPGWQNFLESINANIQDNVILDFGDPAAELQQASSGNVISDLSHLDCLRISGTDAEEFLLNQLSNDIRLLNENQTQLSTYCNPKGRMFALFRVIKLETGYLLISDHGIGSALLGRLKMFVMRSKVDIVDSSDEKVLIGVSGEQPAQLLASVTGCELPSEADQAITIDDILIVRQQGLAPRFLVYCPADKALDLWKKLSANAACVGVAAWEWLDLVAGLPSIHAETSEQFIPQMVNLDILNALNFKKGCYPGQEIIARMKYLGKLKQRMFLGHADTNPPVAGQAIFSPEFGEQSAGTVVNARPAPEGGADLLFVAQLKAVASGKLHIGESNGAAIKLKDLPYSIPTEGETAA